ncbi:murein L,D-transpeptidase catalytic domain family protein [Xanthomonas fragariae]|uniref:L,D-transpeptidase catalytic domain n=1 Tax=Xanthomonas fragariae TaxID=48664 RepID=A0A1Y6HNU5_9XANT|nr:murein L,D-transpeptidase catalytic domain family protein [Xanthomonas fragariae]AOD15109.1 hypothetical protein BER92_10580 [Xanthomonas fragariae]AOD18506.1 hypothetical protein BER93_10600 [Xanthomonas fragariae]MBL9198772.1 murein L,D-transpeptidase catalytic domain family protein [Xanthomonas fragariae]MBL9223027.1 murein L,D-transpeptidase catalytic domain family protein [Xanthomonas fragariae]MDM7556252.1 murein L,D-transpeptidase catalytic domain family protein [Xanthomonas fragaria
MSYRVIAVAAALCGMAAAAPAGAADAISASTVSPRSAPRVGLVDALARQAPSLDRQVLALAAEALQCARQHQQVGQERVLSVIDYSRPSTERRLWVFDLARQRLLFQEWVAHGRNTGNNLAAKFSNDDGSFQSSLGAFSAQESYTGHNGYSLRLNGLEPGFNDHARDRAIVIHGAPYVSEAVIRTKGRLGRSQGCPAVRPAVAKQLIDTLREGAFVFAYYPDRSWLRQSRLLGGGCAASVAGAAVGGR